MVGERKELESGFWAGQNGCVLFVAPPLRNEDAGTVSHVMKGVGDVAELKRLLLGKEHLSTIPSGIPSVLPLPHQRRYIPARICLFAHGKAAN
jgi:hypothetical protein